MYNHVARKLIAGLLAATLASAANTEAEGETKIARKLPAPRPWSVEQVPAKRPAPKIGFQARQRKISVPAVVSGLALIGAGIGMMAASPEKKPSNELRESRSGNVPCTASTYVNGSLTTSRSTTCSYVTVYRHSGVYNGGVALVGTGGLVTLLGLIGKRRQ
jgi:hypothetical protein